MNEVNEFILKLKNKQYISNNLYQFIKINYPQNVPFGFNIDEYNQKVIDSEYIKYKSYFENLYKGIDDNIKLDEEQIKAILTDEDSTLIIAGAGTGKTTTMASKVKYLVDIKKVDPSKIVVISYTKKATEELEQRINIDFNIPALVTTFHSLGYMHIREIFKNRKTYVVDGNKKEEIFLNHFKESIFPNKARLLNLINAFNDVKNKDGFFFSNFFKNNFSKFSSFDSFFNYYKECTLKEIQNLDEWIENRIEKDLNNDEFVRTIKGEIVKSKGEAIIANYLFTHNIEYSYEKVYKELMPDNRTYRPDFTVNYAGEEIYIEYFGLSNYESNELNRYNANRRKKEQYHQKHHTKFIAIDYTPNENILERLEQGLRNFGVKMTTKSSLEIYHVIMDRNKLSQFFPLKNLVFKVIDEIKASSKRKNYKSVINNYISSLTNTDEKNEAKIQFEYIDDFYHYYQKLLYSSEVYGFDYSDMIYYANCYINTIKNQNILNFEYIIIDEYQDISQDRYTLAKQIIARNKAKILAVGDDWQSIFAFSGSEISYFTNFQDYFPEAKLLKITKTYRNSQELINYSGKFIMKNKSQIQKELISDKRLKNPICFYKYSSDEIEALKKLILEIHHENPSHKILILSRNHSMLNACLDDPDLKDDIDSKVTFLGYEDIKIEGMTIHSSKGLASDQVIIIGLNKYFPSDKNGEYWIIDLFKPHQKPEPISFPEERRLFYVALTRTKNKVYLLENENPNYQSPFINEMKKIIEENVK